MPPLSGPRAQQVSRTLASLARGGWASTVVCVEPRPGGPLLRDAGGSVFEAPGVEIVRVPSAEESLWWRVACRIRPTLAQRPDRQRAWIGAAVREAQRQLDRAPHRALVSFGQPWSDHLIGLRLHQSTGLPWVAHFSDPWVDSPYLQVSPGIRQELTRWEADVIGQAQGVVFTTAQTADVVMRKYPAAWMKKVAVVPHGFDRSQLSSIVPEPRTGPPRFRLAHTGRFYAGLRTPTALFDAIALLKADGHGLDDLEVLLMGPGAEAYGDEVARRGIGPNVTLRGRQPAAAALAVAASADALLVIDAPSASPSMFLPSKLIDYLMFRRPIIGLTPVEGASADLLRRLEAPVVAPDSAQAIAAVLADSLTRWREGRLAVSDRFDGVAAEFDIDQTTRGFVRVIEACQ